MVSFHMIYEACDALDFIILVALIASSLLVSYVGEAAKMGRRSAGALPTASTSKGTNAEI